MSPLVCVIIPIYNVEPYLAKCLDSVLAQDYANMQILCINDASPDGCAAILSDYADRDTRIRIFTHEQNQGLSGARNTGLDNAVGEYILFLDSDDWWEPGLVTAVVAKAEQTDADMVWFGQYNVLADATKIAQPPEAADLNPSENPLLYLMKPAAYRGSFSSAWNKLFRRRIIEAEGLRFTDTAQVLWEDMLFTLCYLTVCRRVRSIAGCWINYLQRPGSLVRSGFPQRFTRFFRLCEHYRSFLKAHRLPLYPADYFYWQLMFCRLYAPPQEIPAMFADFKSLAKQGAFRRMMLRLAFGKVLRLFRQGGGYEITVPVFRQRLCCLLFAFGLPRFAHMLI